jgi:hypothetical protein
MTPQKRFEQAATSIAALGRAEITKRLKNFHGRVKLDFTDEYLDKLSIDRLRHILFAAIVSLRQD